MVIDETEKFLLLARKPSCLMQSISITYLIFIKYIFCSCIVMILQIQTFLIPIIVKLFQQTQNLENLKSLNLLQLCKFVILQIPKSIVSTLQFPSSICQSDKLDCKFCILDTTFFNYLLNFTEVETITWTLPIKRQFQ